MNDIALGITHITDWQGYDHMLYLLALVARYDLRHAGKAALLATAFTVGHSLTLAVASLDLFRVPGDWVEFLISLTILVTALWSLRSGEGVAQADVGEAFRWLKSSAEAGSDRAQFNVGVALDPFHPPYGKPGEVDPAMAMIKKDPETAVEFYKMAAEQGHGKAMVNYGICLYEGNGCDKDKEAARQLWVEAMELGIDQASFCLKNMEEKKGEF